MPFPSSRRSYVIQWFVVAALAFCIRGAVLLAALQGWGPLGDLKGDPDSYRLIAETLSNHGTFAIVGNEGNVDPTAFRPPLYPWLLSWLVWDGSLSLTAVAVLHACCGALTSVLVYDVVARGSQSAGKGRGALGSIPAAVAAMLVAGDPLLITQSTLVMTETLATLLVAIIVWGLWRALELERRVSVHRRWVFVSWLMLGTVFAQAYLCRPTFIVWWGLVLLWLVVRRTFKACSTADAVRAGFGLMVPVVLVVALWMVRNERVVGKAYWATSHGGYTLLLGNNPFFYDYLKESSWGEATVWGDAWDAESFHAAWQTRQAELPQRPVEQAGRRVDPEVFADQAAGDWAKQEIREEPGMFVRAVAVRIGRLWSPVPRLGGRVGAISWLVGTYYMVLMMLAGWQALRGGQRLWLGPLGAGLLLVLALTAVHAVYWSNVRMRAPAVPVIVLLAVRKKV